MSQPIDRPPNLPDTADARAGSGRWRARPMPGPHAACPRDAGR